LNLFFSIEILRAEAGSHPLKENVWGYVLLTLWVTIKNDSRINPVRNSSRCDSKPSGALNSAGIILKSNPTAAAAPEDLPPGHEPFRGGAWPGGSSGTLFLTG